MTTEQIKNQLAIRNTLNFMHIQTQRLIAHADIVGNGEQALELDTLRAQVDKLGIIAEETLSHLRSILETQEDMDVVRLYDAQGKAV